MKPITQFRSVQFLLKLFTEPDFQKLVISVVVILLCGIGGLQLAVLKRRQHNELRIGSVAYSFFIAQSQFKQVNGVYATNSSQLLSIIPTWGSSLVDTSVTRLESNPRFGYILYNLSTTPPTEKEPPTFSAVFVPTIKEGFFRTGNDCFYIDQTCILRHSGSPTVIPNAQSPLSK